MTERAHLPEDRYAHLREYATRQKQATGDRLKQAVTQLEEEARPVTTVIIKEISGLDSMAYYRNAEALALFRSHSTHLRQQRAIAQSKRRGAPRLPSGDLETIVSSRDPLLHYKKPRLGAELRASRAKRDQMEQHYQTLLQDHMNGGLTIVRLQTQLAEHQAFLERFHSSLQKEEHGPQSSRRTRGLSASSVMIVQDRQASSPFGSQTEEEMVPLDKDSKKDLEKGTPVEVLLDRQAASVETGLKNHPGVQPISRDRGGAFARGARQGVPEALQTADRFPVLRNLAEVVENVRGRASSSVQRHASGDEASRFRLSFAASSTPRP